MSEKLTLEEINVLNQESFVTAFGSLFEGSSWIVRQTWYARPFASLTELHQAFCTIMYQAFIDQQVALIQAHPDLVGRAALAGTLTPESTNEQASVGLDRLSPQEIATFMRLNQTYRDRFGFPFVICVRENKKESILAGFATRLQHSPSREIETALDEIARICWYRLRDTVLWDGVE